ncbi:MAG TPA: glycosyltransferase, partial [Acidimicrobiia bacterium]|nr:glycosyltransferase [Acidimicrobiia bacterium]
SFSESASASRDAIARQRHAMLADRIAALHPSLASAHAPEIAPDDRREEVARILTSRRFPRDAEPAVLIMVPWLTRGGADAVVETLVRTWTAAGHTVVIVKTIEIGEGMEDRSEEFLELTPYVYDLPSLLPTTSWEDFLVSTLERLGDSVLVNIGSPAFYEFAHAIRRRVPDVRLVDQQFNDRGHLAGNRRCADVIDETIAAYDALAETIRADGRATAVSTVYVGIDLPDPIPDREAARRNLGVEEEPVVAFIGRLSVEKRPEWIVAAAREALDRGDPATFVVVGDGPLHMAMAKTPSNVQWLRRVESAWDIIAAADVLALPSTIEGIPLVAMEALAIGVPVVSTAVGGLPELERFGVVLVDVDDRDAFIDRVLAAARRPPSVDGLPDRFRRDAMIEGYNAAIGRSADPETDA